MVCYYHRIESFESKESQHMEWFEHLLTHTADVLRLILEFLSVLCVGVGLIAVFSSRGPLRSILRRHLPPHLLQRGPLTAARLTFGGWLALALEFNLELMWCKPQSAEKYPT